MACHGEATANKQRPRAYAGQSIGTQHHKPNDETASRQVQAMDCPYDVVRNRDHGDKSNRDDRTGHSRHPRLGLDDRKE